MKKHIVLISYTAVFILSLLFFLYHLFPEEKVNRHLIYSFGQMLPDYQFDINNSRFSLPVALKLFDVSVTKSDNDIFEAASLKIGRPVLSLFLPGQSFFIKAGVYGGKLGGTVTRKENESGHNTRADFKLSGIQIGEWPVLNQLTNGDISGVLNGKISYDDEKTADADNVKLHLTDLTIPFDLPFLEMGDIRFSDAVIEGNLNGQEFLMKKCEAKGKMANAQLSGGINFRDPIDDSILNISGIIQPHHDLLKKIPIGMFSKSRTAGKGLPVTISGTFEKPVFELR